MNCPSRSPDLNLSLYHVCGCAKNTALAVNTIQTPLRRFLDTARHINEIEFLCKVTNSLVTRVIKCMQTNGAHYEQLALSSA